MRDACIMVGWGLLVDREREGLARMPWMGVGGGRERASRKADGGSTSGRPTQTQADRDDPG